MKRRIKYTHTDTQEAGRGERENFRYPFMMYQGRV